jgi:hypothetical protein
MAAPAGVPSFKFARLRQRDAIDQEGVDIGEREQRGGVAQAPAAPRVLKGVLVPAVLSGREVPMRRRAKRNGRGIVRYAERMLSLDDRSPAR